MNCKPGDLAVIVRSAAGNEGRLVEVLSPLGVEPVYKGIRWNLGPSKGAFCWLCRAIGEPLETVRGLPFMEFPVADMALRPIRPQPDDAQDESKAWLPPVPSITKEHA